MLKNYVELVCFLRLDNYALVLVLQSNHFATPLLIVRMESANNYVSYLVSSMSFRVDHLERCNLSTF